MGLEHSSVTVCGGLSSAKVPQPPCARFAKVLAASSSRASVPFGIPSLRVLAYATAIVALGCGSVVAHSAIHGCVGLRNTHPSFGPIRLEVLAKR